jgi:RNA polymerase sigma-70 factor, ECF subfamily
MDSSAEIFSAYRRRLFGIAYRMLGSRADAEDILQETYLRWIDSKTSAPRSIEAWLVTVVTRLYIDRLRSAQAEREVYTGSWLPEPLVSPEPLSPDRTLELASDLSIAFLLVLERLAPDERAAFLLHEVFDFAYAEIGRILGKTPAACRQIVHRAKQRVQDDRPRFSVSREAHGQLLEKFLAAASAGRREQIMSLLADEVRVTTDGGGKVSSFRKVLQGADRVARFYAGLSRKFAGRSVYRLAEINGAPGLLRYLDGELESAQAFVMNGTQICKIYIVRNPDKLKGIVPG